MRAEALWPFPPPAPRAQARPAQGLALLAMLLLLPGFMQVFQYLADVRPLLNLSKVTPLLLLPLTLLGLFRLRLPYVALTLVLLAWLLLVAPVMSMLQLQNNLPEGLAGTVKVWAFSFYFAAAWLLVWLRVTEVALTRALVILAFLNFAILLLLWVAVPVEYYARAVSGTSIFLADNERGPRVLLPMVFGLIGMFWLARRFAARPAFWPVVLLLIGLALLVVIYKQRVIIGSLTLIVLWGMTLPLRQRAPALFWGLALAGGGLAGAMLPIVAPLVGGSLRASLGGSLLVRENAAAVLVDFLSEDPLRWIFGVGGSTEFSAISLQDILRTPDFFFADLGWLGLVGEYGVVGAGIILLFYLAALRETRRAALLSPTPMRQALRDFVAFLLLTSPILSLVFTPGQIATVLAIAVCWQRAATQG